MTAIFLVWNRSGLSVAADSAISILDGNSSEVGKVKSISNAEVSKILRVPNRSVLVAHSGDTSINEVPITGIISRWAENCPSFDSLYDYAENFIRWFAEDSFLEKVASDEYIMNSITSQLSLIKKAISNQEFGEKTPVEVVEDYYAYWETSSHPNIFGSARNKFKFSENSSEAEDIFSRFISQFSNLFDEEVHLQYLKEVERAFEGAYEMVFEDSPWFDGDGLSQLKFRCVKFNIDYIFEDEQTTLMIAGYGEKDWIPSCVVLNIFDCDHLIPRIVVTSVTNPNLVWYQEIGRSDAVAKFFSPIEDKVLLEIQERLESKFKNRKYLEKVKDEIDEIISGHSLDLIDPMRKRIKLFNSEQLAFVAAQMVALESLNSLIKEDLPSVGGRIDVVQLTRAGFIEDNIEQ